MLTAAAAEWTTGHLRDKQWGSHSSHESSHPTAQAEKQRHGGQAACPGGRVLVQPSGPGPHPPHCTLSLSLCGLASAHPTKGVLRTFSIQPASSTGSRRPKSELPGIAALGPADGRGRGTEQVCNSDWSLQALLLRGSGTHLSHPEPWSHKPMLRQLPHGTPGPCARPECEARRK